MAIAFANDYVTEVPCGFLNNQILLGRTMSSVSMFKKCPGCGADQPANASVCSQCHRKLRKKVTLWKWIGSAFAGLIVLGALSGPPTKPSGTIKAELADQVTLDYEWRTQIGGLTMEADFVVSNKLSEAIKDIQVTCIHFSKTNTKIDSNSQTLYEIVPAHRTIKVSNVAMGFIHSEANSTNCKITKFAKA